MGAEYLKSDVAGLLLLADLYQQFWTAPTVHEKVRFAAEIRQQESRYGLSPLDRRRLQWTVELGEAAVERTARRRRARQLPAETGQDPREVLKIER
jgi:hypothetical protein